MFTGVGGFEIGIGNKGKCIGFSEINKYSNELLKNKFPKIRNYGDARKINPHELPEFDLLCGGFPCQAFSIAGKRRGFKDTRGTLFFEIARILKIKRPKIILLENVKGLLNHEKGKTFGTILHTLDELGYEVQWMVLNSKFFGVPQNRERVFIIGCLRGQTKSEILPFRESNKSFDEGNVPGIPTSQSLRSEYYKGGKGTHINAVLTPNRPEKRQNGRRFKKDGEPSFTLTGQDIHGIMMVSSTQAHSTKMKDLSPTLPQAMGEGGGHVPMKIERFKIRKLTPLECERLQGFPDNWTKGFSDTQRYKMMGNAVTVNVIKAISKRLF